MPMRVEAGRYAHYRKSSAAPVTSEQRKGYRGELSVLEALEADATLMPIVERDARLIEGIRIVGADDLTARDQALYQLLLDVAREQGIDRGLHQLPTDRVWTYLQGRETKEIVDRRPERLQDSLVRLTRTVVRYTWRDQYNRAYGVRSLLSSADVYEDMASGAAHMDYSIPDAVRYAIQSTSSYTHLSLSAFAAFRSRYSARLYQHLALRAGYDGPAGKVWNIPPIDLAKLLNYPVRKGLHYASFRKRCLTPAMEDIKEHVGAFKVCMKEEPGPGRGRPIVKLIFEITDVWRSLETYKAADVDVRLHPLEQAGRHPAEHVPSRLMQGRAVTLTGHRPEPLLAAWQDALDLAKSDRYAEIIPGRMRAYELGQMLQWQGLKAAYATWVYAVHAHGSIPKVLPKTAADATVIFSPPSASQYSERTHAPRFEPDELERLERMDLIAEITGQDYGEDDVEPPQSFFDDGPRSTGEVTETDEIPF